ncbi:MAG: DUF3810 domain-containing protein [Bacteroidota bacterium]
MTKLREISWKDSSFIWIMLGLLTLLLRWLFSINPAFTEILYSRGIFQVIRVLYDFTVGWIPIAFLYLLAPLLLFLGMRRLIKGIKTPMSIRKRLGKGVINLLAFFSGVFFLFHFLWAFNYFRTPVEQQLGLTEIPSDTTFVVREFKRMSEEMMATRALIGDTSALSIDVLPPQLEDSMRSLLEEVLAEYSFPVIGRVRGRKLLPFGMLMRSGATGIYIPFAMEGHLDGGLTAPAVPSTMAHEMAHGYGFGDEGSCNFWAYLACERSSNPVIRYSGQFEYWIYVARQYRKLFPKQYAAYRKTLPKGILNDIELIKTTYKKYPGFFPQTSAYVYDQYLKSQGIKEGSFSYSRVVQLVISWREKYETADQ